MIDSLKIAIKILHIQLKSLHKYVKAGSKLTQEHISNWVLL
jgi:hypothetical protein